MTRFGSLSSSLGIPLLHLVWLAVCLTSLGAVQADFLRVVGSGVVSPIGYVHTLYKGTFSEISANYKSVQSTCMSEGPDDLSHSHSPVPPLCLLTVRAN